MMAVSSLSRQDGEGVRKILLISLTNIGDVILTFPVLDILRHDFPEAELSVIIGPKAASLLKGNRHLHAVHIFDKHQGLRETLALLQRLRAEHFDWVVDLRNSAMPFLIGPRRRTSPFMGRLEGHPMREQHLGRLRGFYAYEAESPRRYAVELTDSLPAGLEAAMTAPGGGPWVTLAPGAADERKRWPEACFARLGDLLIKRYGVRIIFVGGTEDRPVVERIRCQMTGPSTDVSGTVDLAGLGQILSRSALLVSNDSAPMHLASYLDIPVVALFGPTDPVTYGPWGTQGRVMERKRECPACRGEEGAGDHVCLQKVDVLDVLNALEWKEGHLAVKTAVLEDGLPREDL